MDILSKFAKHMDLMSRMMARTGAVRGMNGGDHMEAALRQATFRCAACADTEACGSWLENAPEGANPPAFCRNAALMESIVEECGGFPA